MTYLLRLQLLFEHCLPLMQPAKPIDLLLVLTADFVFFIAAAAFLVFSGELGVLSVLIRCPCVELRSVKVLAPGAWGRCMTDHAWVQHLGCREEEEWVYVFSRC